MGVNVFHVRTALRAAALALAALALLAVVLGLVLSAEVREPQARAATGGGSESSTTEAGAVPPLAEFEPIWTTDYYSMDHSAIAVATEVHVATETASPAATDEIPAQLVGTVGRKIALLTIGDGQIYLRGVGETTPNNVEVLEVGPGRIIVRYQGRSATLERPKEPQS